MINRNNGIEYNWKPWINCQRVVYFSCYHDIKWRNIHSIFKNIKNTIYINQIGCDWSGMGIFKFDDSFPEYFFSQTLNEMFFLHPIHIYTGEDERVWHSHQVFETMAHMSGFGFSANRKATAKLFELTNNVHFSLKMTVTHIFKVI